MRSASHAARSRQTTYVYRPRGPMRRIQKAKAEPHALGNADLAHAQVPSASALVTSYRPSPRSGCGNDVGEDQLIPKRVRFCFAFECGGIGPRGLYT